MFYTCPFCHTLAAMAEHDTFELGLNKVRVTFHRMRCRHCQRIHATQEQSQLNQRRLRAIITRVKIPIAWPRQDTSPWGQRGT